MSILLTGISAAAAVIYSALVASKLRMAGPWLFCAALWGQVARRITAFFLRDLERVPQWVRDLDQLWLPLAISLCFLAGAVLVGQTVVEEIRLYHLILRKREETQKG